MVLKIIKKLLSGWNHFWHREEDLSIFGPLRIGLAALLLINVLSWWPDLDKWFGEDGVLPLDISKMVIDPETHSIFEWLPRTSFVLWTCYLLLITNLVCLLLGFLTRIQLIFVFVLFTSFCHRNNLIVDGEDNMFRMLTFYMIFAPAGKYLSIDAWLSGVFKRNRNRSSDVELEEDEKTTTKKFAIWPLRLIQIQTSCVLLFSGIEKFRGAQWRDGTALYYVSRLDDFFYRLPVPDFLFNSLTMVAIATWSALLLELTAPFLVWFGRTRMIGLFVVISFHLTIDYMMNLNLFQWVMILGWCSFLRPEHLVWCKSLKNRKP